MSTPTPRLLTALEAARELGLPEHTIYRELRLGRIPHISLGRRRYISRDALEALLSAQGTTPAPARGDER